jgi:hypothetical protein
MIANKSKKRVIQLIFDDDIISKFNFRKKKSKKNKIIIQAYTPIEHSLYTSTFADIFCYIYLLIENFNELDIPSQIDKS